jgi:integrase/recombinase XerD
MGLSSSMKDILAKFEVYLLTQQGASPATLSAYMTDLRQLFSFLEEPSDIGSITKTHLIDFLQSLKVHGCTARTMARKVASLKAFFGWVALHYNCANPAHLLVTPKLEKRLPIYLTETEVQQLLTTAYTDTSPHASRNSLLLSILYAGGLRISELTVLCWKDVRLEEALLHVNGKGNKERLVPLPEAVIKQLLLYKTTYFAHFVQAHGSCDYIFPVLYSGAVRPISRQAVWVILKQLCHASGIMRKISPHTLRHSLATHLLQQGAHLRSLQTLLGHENISTVEVYTHLETAHLRKVYDKKHPRS